MSLSKEQRDEAIVCLIIGVLALVGGLLFGEARAAELPRDAVRYQRDLTRQARQVWGIDAPVATFAAQIHQESRWRSDAVSQAGALGMAQFMPATARWISGAYPQLIDNQPTNPVWAMRALVTYDRHLWQRVQAAGQCDRMAMVLSGYNGGLGWVWRDQKLAAARGGDPSRWFDQVERFNAGRSAAAFRENRDYPRLILRTHEPRYVAAGWGLGSCA